MAKQKQKHRQLPPRQLFEVAKRELAKGQIKEALGMAKSLFRQCPGNGERELLESCFAARIDQLLGAGASELALAQLRELIEFQPRTADVVARLPRWKILLGISSPELDTGGVIDPAIAGELVDLAVRQRKCECIADPAVRAEVGKVIEALAAIEAGQDEQAEGVLREIPRASPCADWRLFARGLAAFYAADIPRAMANWDRLDSARAATRIAQTLLVAQGHRSVEQATIPVADRVRRLRNGVLGGSTRHDLDRFAACWKEGARRQAIPHLADLWRKKTPETESILHRLREFTWKSLVREGDLRSVESLAKTLPGPPLDPRWNRALALANKEYRTGSPNAFHDYFQAYLKEVQQMDLPQESRDWIAGLVHHHVATILGLNVPKVDEDDDREAAERILRDYRWFCEHVRQAFEASIRHCPTWRQGYLSWAQFLSGIGQPDGAAKVYRRLVAQLPDDWEGHLWLARYLGDCDDLSQATVHLEVLQRLRPRDASTESLQWQLRVSAVRLNAKKKRLNEARRLARELDSKRPLTIPAYQIPVIQAAVEYKAEDPAAAGLFLQKAQEMAPSHAVVALALAHVGSQYGLHREMKKDVDQRITAELAAPCTGKASASLCQYFLDLSSRGVRYRGLVSHGKAVRKQLATARVFDDWSAEELRTVCRWLLATANEREDAQVRELARYGQIRYPEDPYFLYASSVNKFRRHRWEYSPPLLQDCQRVLELNQHGRPALLEDELRELHRILDCQRQMHECPEGGPFSFGFPGDFDDEADDDEEFSADEFGAKGGDAAIHSLGGTRTANGGISLPEGVLKELLRTLPPSMRRTLDQAADEIGLSPLETLRKMMESGEPLELPK